MTKEEKKAQAQAKREEAKAQFDALPKWKKFVINGIIALVVAVVVYTCINQGSIESMPSTTYAYNAVKESIKSYGYSLQQDGVNEMSFPLADYHAEYLNDSTYMVVSHIDYKNNFGVKQKFGYKARIKYLGGDKNSITSWQMTKFEEYNH
ncbi:MAG: hypothetical protein SNG79_01305 [Rikenellaceae bacterium]